MGFSRQEYWSGLPLPPPGDLPDPGLKPASPPLQEDSLLLSRRGSPARSYRECQCQSEEKGVQVCWRVFQASSCLVFSIWCSVTRSYTFVFDSASPVTHFWASLRRCFLSVRSWSSLTTESTGGGGGCSSIMKAGLAGPTLTTDTSSSTTSHPSILRGWLLLGISNLNVK